VDFENLDCTDFELIHQIPLHLGNENMPQNPHLNPIKTFSAVPKYSLEFYSMVSIEPFSRLII